MEPKVFTSERIIVAAFAVILFWSVIMWVRTDSAYSGVGYVDAFPDADNAKNYRLEADIDVDPRISDLFGITNYYTIKRIHWPNGGYSDLGKCVIEQGAGEYCSSDDQTFHLEVVTPPDEPS